MADGPCGEQFKEAFSCFVFSTEEPKGLDCVEKFKHMQDCFRAHPAVYGEGESTSAEFVSFSADKSEIDDDEDMEAPQAGSASQTEGGVKPPTDSHPADSPTNKVSPETTPTKCECPSRRVVVQTNRSCR